MNSPDAIEGANVVLLTCLNHKSLVKEDRALSDALVRRGLRVSVAVWNEPQLACSLNEATKQLVVVRTTWDYHQQHEVLVTYV
jgi:hypothetical protein